MNFIELRSDTCTKPTEAMKKAMYNAEVGDEGYKTDPTVIRLEELAAEKVGKEDAVFCVSGTMANMLGIMVQTFHADEIICEDEAHIYWYENSGLALLPNVQAVLVPGRHFRHLDPNDVRAVLKPFGPGPSRRLLCIENTHNRAGGTVMSVSQTAELCEIAHSNGLGVHLDGARIFNAAAACGVDASKLAEQSDTLMFCLSKSLGAPMGSMLCGSKKLIDKARAFRYSIGGRLRQSGVVAAAGIVALETMIDRLPEDHANAKILAQGVAEIPGLTIDLESIQTNIVKFEVTGLVFDAPGLVAALKPEGVMCTSHSKTQIRMVTHNDVSRAEVKEATQRLSKVARENLRK